MLTSGKRSGSVRSTRSGFAASSSSGDTIGMSVPGIRLPCLAGDASATAASNRESIPARVNSATARDAGAVRDHGVAGSRLRFEPTPKRLGVPIALHFEAGDNSGLGHVQRVLGLKDSKY